MATIEMFLKLIQIGNIFLLCAFPQLGAATTFHKCIVCVYALVLSQVFERINAYSLTPVTKV